MDRPKRRPRTVQSGRAQSQVLGFMLVVAIALTATFAVSYVGIEVLSQPTEGQPQSIATSQVETHAQALHAISNGAPFRSTEFSGSEANIRYGDPVTITVSGTSSTDTLAPITIQPEPLIYDVGETQLVSVGGAVLLQDDNGGMVLKQAPAFEFAPQQSTIPLIETIQNGGSDSVGIGDNQPAYVANHRWSTSSTRFEPIDGNGDLVGATITITIESPRYEAWATYFRDHSQVTSVSTSPASNRVSAEINSDRVIIQQTEVHLQIDI